MRQQLYGPMKRLIVKNLFNKLLVFFFIQFKRNIDYYEFFPIKFNSLKNMNIRVNIFQFIKYIEKIFKYMKIYEINKIYINMIQSRYIKS
ncbi:unnamed protein product [Onchocerca flexuosa]|uniref:Uncharacterized protein n=1 Tax=Onchocerca flexuosa TaxID=387005 RepID=A0A183HX62_9BILA|nr:unnamed protein product [Onchocerca flexuosa]